MNLNREQFLKAVERGQALLKELKKDYPELKLTPVFSRFGPGSGQCDLTTDFMKMFKEFPEMLVASEDIKLLRRLLRKIKEARAENNKDSVARLQKEERAVKQKLLDANLPVYCGDVLIEYRPDNLKYEPLRRLQQDSRLPPGLNTVGNIRVIAGSLEFLNQEL
jgi:hypothetical protein